MENIFCLSMREPAKKKKGRETSQWQKEDNSDPHTIL